MEDLDAVRKELEKLTEGDELGGLREERQKVRESEEILLESMDLKRPSLLEETKDKIKKRADKDPNGEFIDPNTKEIVKEPVFGHVYGREHRRLVLRAAEKGMNQEQFNRWVNEHPEWFQIEERVNNESHRFEKKGTHWEEEL